MSVIYHFFTVIYPYICLTIFIGGLIFRYLATPGEWNAKSSEIFEHRKLRIGSMLFHYGILFSLVGHIGGLLVPTALLGVIGLNIKTHMEVAGFLGRIITPVAFIGLAILLWRRLGDKRVYATTNPMDLIIVALIFINILTGGYQTFTETFPALGVLGMWIRGILTFHPDPFTLMELPWFMWLHILSGMTIFALAPFSRLVHIFSLPYTYCIYPLLTYRKRYGDL